MTPTVPETLKEFFLSRDVKLNPSASEDQIALFTARTGIVIHPYVVSIYRCFNGFANNDFDAKNMMEIWPLERVCSEDSLFTAGYMPFSDLFGNAEIYMQSFDDPWRPVIAMFKEVQIASSTYAFWEKYLAGGFDF